MRYIGRYPGSDIFKRWTKEYKNRKNKNRKIR